MEQPHLLNEYTKETECTYKGERYSVRDNGAVLRHSINESSHPRKLDETWTFGKKDITTGYMFIGKHRVHIIVATAFYGEMDSKEYVVDHIDTNRSNNRCENLRWVTKLDNALRNPATRKKIEYLCGGDIQRFIDNPECLKGLCPTKPNVGWMRPVSKEEAYNSKKRLDQWICNSSHTSLHNEPGEWIFTLKKGVVQPRQLEALYEMHGRTYYPPTPIRTNNKSFFQPNTKSTDYMEYPTPSLYPSLTITAKQLKWSTPTLFPMCPLSYGETPLEDYMANLKIGKIVSSNANCDHVVDEFDLSDKGFLIIRTHAVDNEKFGGFCKYSLITVIYENGFFVHSGKTFHEEIGAKKYYALELGREWTGGDCFDDYC